jgi:CheY-like chemotaxis protein
MTTRVLLVDDVAETRRLVRTALRFRGGFEVVGEASDGVEAVRQAAALQPDIVVLDLVLPDIAGDEVLIGVREGSPASKIVVFSGAEITDRDWFLERTEGFVVKDVDLDYLVDLLASLVAPPRGAETIELPRHVDSVARARDFTRGRIAAWQLTPLLDDALLVVSELVANAITHAASAPRLSLSYQDGTLRIEVTDDGTGTPEPRAPSTTREGGRGLYLISAMASVWGTEEVDGGKVVWAELRVP